MVLPMVLPKSVSYWLLSCYRAARRIKSTHGFFLFPKRSHHPSPTYPPLSTFSLSETHSHHTSLSDFDTSLLRTPTLFPFFMLVSFEAGGLLRALLLLISYPILFLIGHQNSLTLKLMTFITFHGLKPRDINLVARAVLPKFYLEQLHYQAYQVLASTERRVVVTSMPRVMVEGFLKEYLAVDEVVGAELEVAHGSSYFNGFMSIDGLAAKQRALGDLFGETKADVAIVGSSTSDGHLLLSCSKETYIIKNQESNSPESRMPRNKYPKPLIFHDGRLAFLPTPLATLSLFIWIPFGILLSITRILAGILLPYHVSIIIMALTGVRFRTRGLNPSPARTGTGLLYVCTHRTLLDPVMLSTALARPVPAVTYSLSRMSEFLSPIRTVRLNRDRVGDADIMRRMLAVGDLAVCPEGTTCREPYLLRFSSLFAELGVEMVPVALEARSSLLYGTTASGLKWLDPVLFLANPRPGYRVEFLDRVQKEMTCAGGWTGWEVANRVQKELGEALGYECTGLTRKDKYLMLAGNEGVVQGDK